jgi:hypothetical protein
MHLDPGGHPLHTRALGVTLAVRADGRLDARATILDLRKRGFVPVGSDLQPSGIVHHMIVDAVVDPVTGRIETIGGTQPAVAFEASALSQGESCRDPIGRVALLAGADVRRDWGEHVSNEIGGPRGCSHVLTATHLLGSTVAWALDQDEARFGRPARWPGERVFRRDVIVDGHERRPGHLALALQLTDLHYAPAPPVAPSMDRFAEAHEVRGLAEVELGRFALERVALSERRREKATLATATWRDRTDVAGALAGQSLARGVSAALLERRAAAPGDAPVFDGLLMLAPALIQTLAALTDDWAALAAERRWVVGMSGRPDSCWMWRADGPLQRARGENEPPTG